MNSRERMRVAMQGRQPDRVPVWCPLSLEHILRHGWDKTEPPETIEEFVEIECALTRRYGFDGVVLYLPAERKGAMVRNWLAKLGEIQPESARSHVFEEADPESWPQPKTVFDADECFAGRLARDILPDAHIGGWTPDGFSKAVQWFPDVESALIGLVQDPERFKAIVRYFDLESVACARAQVALGGIESMHISSPYAGASFISRATYEEMVLESVAAIAEAMRPTPAFSYLHTCGFIADRLDLLADTGIDGMECMDPPPLGNTCLGAAKKQVGHRVFLKGNIDSVHVLLQGTDEQVDNAIRGCLKDGMPHGGYILSTACSVAPAVDPRRVRRLYELAEEHGGYGGEQAKKG